MTAPFDLAFEVLRTERLDLLPLPLDFCRAIVNGDRTLAARILGYDVGEWPEGGELRLAFPAYVAALERDPSAAGWQGRAIVVRGGASVAGSVNLKGRPQNGRAEVGYGLLAPYRGRGYAREAARATVARAFADPATAEVVAVIERANAPSVRVAEAIGMRRTGELSSEHPGSYVWRVTRDEWRPR